MPSLAARSAAASSRSQTAIDSWQAVSTSLGAHSTDRRREHGEIQSKPDHCRRKRPRPRNGWCGDHAACRQTAPESTRLYRSFIEGPFSRSGVRTSVAETGRITPSDCGCGGGNASLVYALGQLGYDFGSEARRDSFVQQGIKDPHDPGQLLSHLKADASQATAVIWTLAQDATPIYAIRPAGPFAAETYERLWSFSTRSRRKVRSGSRFPE